MLDIRAVAYISPVAEVEFASVPLTVRIVNVADETGLVTGTFRVYNDNTGLLIHTSAIVPFSLAAGESFDASALTDFDPPAPLDDVYFVLFDGTASNALVPDGIGIHLGAFHFDVKPVGMGPAPATHYATHENGGSDELETTNLGTAELDDTLVLAPDGAGGVEFRPEAGGGGGAHASSHEAGGADQVHHIADIHPAIDSVTALQILKADGTSPVLDVDTTNLRVGINNAAPSKKLEVTTTVAGDGAIIANIFIGCWAASNAYASIVNKNVANPTNHYAFIQDNNGDTWFNAAGTLTFNINASGPKFAIYSASAYSANPLGIGVSPPTAHLDINSDILRLRTAKTPATSGAAGNAGDICWDSDYIYVCVAANTWKRAAIATW
jgi:hypothetical protein